MGHSLAGMAAAGLLFSSVLPFDPTIDRSTKTFSGSSIDRSERALRTFKKKQIKKDKVLRRREATSENYTSNSWCSAYH